MKDVIIQISDVCLPIHAAKLGRIMIMMTTNDIILAISCSFVRGLPCSCQRSCWKSKYAYR